MPVSCKSENGKLVCVFEGRMDSAGCQAVGGELDNQVASHSGEIVFDLKGVDFIASAFLRFCVKAASRAAGHKFSVVNASPDVRMVFKIARLSDKMEVS